MLDSIADRVRILRERQRLDQKELSSLSGVSDSQISSIESGETKHPRTDTVLKLAKALGVTRPFLLGDEDTDFEELEHALCWQALRLFLESDEGKKLEKGERRLLEDIADDNAGPISPSGWSRLTRYLPQRSKANIVPLNRSSG